MIERGNLLKARAQLLGKIRKIAAIDAAAERTMSNFVHGECYSAKINDSAAQNVVSVDEREKAGRKRDRIGAKCDKLAR